MNKFRFPCLSSLFALAAVMIGSISHAKAADKSPNAEEKTPKAQLMFVQVAEDLKVDPKANTIRLVKVNPQTLYFSDRPQRIAGHLKMADYLKEWTAKAGKDNFGAKPPNAALSVYEAGQADNTLAVVEITNPVVDGGDLVYSYKLINGKMPATGGATTLFIDWIAARGGFSYHGVAVGGRGFGFRR